MTSCCSSPLTRRALLAGTAAVAVLGAMPKAGAARPSDKDKKVKKVKPEMDGMLVLAGSFHDHSTDSDGDAPSSAIADYLGVHHEAMGLDFLSFTEHSDFFPLSLAGADPWQRSRAVTDAHTGEGFTMLRGFEHTNDQQNHLNVIESANWLRHHDELTMEPFYRWLASSPTGDAAGTGAAYGGADGIGQFNHPSSKGALNWDDYAFHPEVAAQMATIEVRERALGWYWFALSRGWTLGPVQNADFHNWAKDGVLTNSAPGSGSGKGFYPSLRTLVLAERNTRADIVEALRQRRTSASEQPDLWATLRGPRGEWQGSTLAAAPGQELFLTVEAGSEASELERVELVTDGTVEDFVHFYGENKSCTNPADPADCGQHVPSYELQRVRYQQSGGQATRKGGIDTPPPGRTQPVVPLTGLRERRTVRLVVPSTASTRPDGKHFAYAVVTRRDGARVITSPLFLDPR